MNSTYLNILTSKITEFPEPYANKFFKALQAVVDLPFKGYIILSIWKQLKWEQIHMQGIYKIKAQERKALHNFSDTETIFTVIHKAIYIAKIA